MMPAFQSNAAPRRHHPPSSQAKPQSGTHRAQKLQRDQLEREREHVRLLTDLRRIQPHAPESLLASSANSALASPRMRAALRMVRSPPSTAQQQHAPSPTAFKIDALNALRSARAERAALRAERAAKRAAAAAAGGDDVGYGSEVPTVTDEDGGYSSAEGSAYCTPEHRYQSAGAGTCHINGGAAKHMTRGGHSAQAIPPGSDPHSPRGIVQPAFDHPHSSPGALPPTFVHPHSSSGAPLPASCTCGGDSAGGTVHPSSRAPARTPPIPTTTGDRAARAVMVPASMPAVTSAGTPPMRVACGHDTTPGRPRSELTPGPKAAANSELAAGVPKSSTTNGSPMLVTGGAPTKGCAPPPGCAPSKGYAQVRHLQPWAPSEWTAAAEAPWPAPPAATTPQWANSSGYAPRQAAAVTQPPMHWSCEGVCRALSCWMP